ncbi:LPXTG-site transpeptidase family protein [hydrothermal vent metagenome]|uniref:LPXTG-site transpeptidase family protein n=1 Tax=hydrothermal vent metagenome TaxID=652676 RepID=A0A3B1B6S0_9ZZZZ
MHFALLKIYYRLRFIKRKLKIKTYKVRKKLKPAWKKSRFRIIMLLLFGLAIQQLGQGSYIYAKAIFSQYLIDSAWQKTLQGQDEVKPWSWADTWPVAKLTSKKHHTKLFILAGDNGRTLAFGPGYRFGTELPGGMGTSVISGHRDTHFSFLQDVQLLDEFEIQNKEGEVLKYRVSDTKVISIDEGFKIEDDSSSKITLVTCYPFNSIISDGNLRYIVTAKKLEMLLANQ